MPAVTSCVGNTTCHPMLLQLRVDVGLPLRCIVPGVEERRPTPLSLKTGDKSGEILEALHALVDGKLDLWRH